MGPALANLPNGVSKNMGAAIGQFIPVDRSQDAMAQIERCHAFGHPPGFIFIQGCRPASFDVTKTTRAGTGVAHEQKRSRAPAPTFPQVGTHGFLAHGMQAMLSHQALDPAIIAAPRQFHLQPGRFALGQFRF